MGIPISEENFRGISIHRVGQDIIKDSLTEEGRYTVMATAVALSLAAFPWGAIRKTATKSQHQDVVNKRENAKRKCEGKF
jgi:hypothetical protein